MVYTTEDSIDKMLKADNDIGKMLANFLRPILEEGDIAKLLAEGEDLNEKLLTLMQKARMYDETAGADKGRLGQAALLRFARKDSDKK